MRTYGLLMAAALLVAAPAVCSAETPLEMTRPAIVVQTENKVGMELYNSAYESYISAKKSTDRIKSAEHYSIAIAGIAKANTAEPDCVEYLALAMQAYRGKGVLAYAQGSFKKAEKVLQARLKANPADYEALLDYAILCYAGDMAYTSECDLYKEKAEKMAAEIVQLTQNADSFDKLRVRGLAQLILGQTESFKRTMYQLPVAKAKVEKPTTQSLKSADTAVDNAKIENMESGVIAAEEIETVGEITAVYDEGSANAHFRKMYEETVEVGEWLWPVHKDYLTREYLLYTLRDFTR